MSERSFRKDLVEAIPPLRAFARSLSGDRDQADDLVQETLTKAMVNREKFTPGTNLQAWLVTILRNQYYSEGRKRRREVPDSDGEYMATLIHGPGQSSRMELIDFMVALQLLPDDQREALILIGASGFSYQEAAQILGTRVGTVKSRVSRARARLEELINGEPEFDRDEAAITKSAVRLRDAFSS